MRENKNLEYIFKQLETSELKVAENIYFGDNEINLKETLSMRTPLVIRAVSSILLDAIEKDATDIHIEVYEENMRIRYRIDGRLIEIKRLDKNSSSAIVSRIKIMSNLDISEKRVPQDGRMKIKIKDTYVDFRIAIIPTINGEKVGIRILKSGIENLKLEKLSFSEKNKKILERNLESLSGLILVTGPTGSGKSTTLYTILNHLNHGDKNISTVEDPVEYNLYGINQVQARSDIGLSFSVVLKQLLRQDPDILMVGEIRDKETVEIGIKAALTGHLVLSTLHTKNALSSIMRLENLGIESYLISAALKVVISQRLVRRLCESCKVIENSTKIKIKKMKLSLKKQEIYSEKKFFTNSIEGCECCNFTGYRGRIAIHEILEINEELRDGIEKRLSLKELEKILENVGSESFVEDGLKKAEKGITSLNEIIEVTY
ncbi:MAG: GspE/PulE family protein [Fusobacteriaceae bacterium]